MKKQVCVRTYPPTYSMTTKRLNDYLSKGYYVVMATTINLEKGGNIVEYILEKNE